jgi:hypothetical protein
MVMLLDAKFGRASGSTKFRRHGSSDRCRVARRGPCPEPAEGMGTRVSPLPPVHPLPGFNSMPNRKQKAKPEQRFIETSASWAATKTRLTKLKRIATVKQTEATKAGGRIRLQVVPPKT